MPKILEIQEFYQHVAHTEYEPLKNEGGDFNIFRIEDLLLNPERPATYSRRNFYKISLITGHSRIHYADRNFEVNGSALVFTNPMVPYHWEVITTQQKGHMCILTEAFFGRFGNLKDLPVFQSAENAIVLLSEVDAERFNRLFLRMEQELLGNYAYKYDLLRNLLMECIHEAQKMQPVIGTSVTGSNAAERIASLFSQLLDRQFPIELSNQTILLKAPSDYARQLNIHVNHLNKALKEITGKTTSQHIAERILQEARVLLRNTTWTIAEIAYGLGFDEPNHFSGFFKNKLKMSPVKFRQQID